MRLITLFRRADPLGRTDRAVSARGRAELRALVGPVPGMEESPTAARNSSVLARVVMSAAAVVVAAAVFLVPRLGGPGRMDAVPARSPAPAATSGSWARTAPAGLSARRDVLTAWVDGRFLLVGGYTAAPCKPGEECSGRPRDDGALYDPVRDTWTTITNAPRTLAQPEGSNPYARTATVGDTVYIQDLNGAVLAYHSRTDVWDVLPAPPGGGTGTLAGGFEGRLVVLPWGQCAGTRSPCTRTETTSYWTYDPGSRKWTVHTVALRLPSSVNGASTVADDMVVSWLGSGTTLGSAVIDLRSEKVSMMPDTPIPLQRPVPAAAGRVAVWSRDHQAWFLDPASRTWSSVSPPTRPGPLSRERGAVPVSVGSMVALNGYLYDPTSRLWSTTPALPIPTTAAVLAGGPDSALACFGYDTSAGSYDGTCYVLKPGPASQPEP